MEQCWARPHPDSSRSIVRKHDESLLLAAVMLAAKHCSTDANAGGGKAWNYAAYAKASGLAEGELKVSKTECVMMPAGGFDQRLRG